MASRPAVVEIPEGGSLEAAPSDRYSLLRRQGRWKDALRRRMLALADLLAWIAGAVAASLAGLDAPVIWWVVAAFPLWLVLAKARRLYALDHARLGHSTLDELSALFEAVIFCVAATALLLALLGVWDLSANGAIVLGGVALVAAVAFRALARILWQRLVPAERTLVLGAGPLADAVVRKLELESGHHVAVAETLGLRSGRRADTPSAIGVDELRGTLIGLEAERVIVAVTDLSEEALSAVVATCRKLGVKLSVVPPLRAMLGTAVDLHHLAELPVIAFRTWDPSRSTRWIRRSVDVVVSGVALVLVAPIMMVTALAVRLDSPGWVLFRQRRVGEGGREFTMLKFRTMVDGACDQLADVMGIEELAEPMFKLRADPRVTRVGRVLRRASLDELPQLINVLRGEMSLVGPRPEEPWLVERYQEADRFRLEVRPGMTGPMQVHGRGELTFSERLAVEREYIENYTLRKDLKIILRTVGAVVRGRGAF